MMFYCPRCCRLWEQDRCPDCGSWPLMAPKQEDLCFLEETDALWAGTLEDVLSQAGIPCLKRAGRSAAIRVYVGMGREKISFYVPFGRYTQARDLADGLFHLPESTENV